MMKYFCLLYTSLGKAVAAASAYHHILDTVVGAHTLHGALAHVEHLRRLCRVKQLVFGFPLPFLLEMCIRDRYKRMASL